MNLFKLKGFSAENFMSSTGNVNTLDSNFKFRDDLLVLLLTRKGTLIGDPDFGSTLEELLFEPASEATASAIRQEIANCIEKYYPSFVVTNVDISYFRNSVQANISYRLLNSNVEDTVMLDFINGN